MPVFGVEGRRGATHGRRITAAQRVSARRAQRAESVCQRRQRRSGRARSASLSTHGAHAEQAIARLFSFDLGKKKYICFVRK